MALRSWLLLLIFLATPLAALAGGTATVQSGASSTDKLSVKWRDTANMRLQQAGKTQYFLMRDGKGYVVMSRDGKPRVFDVSSMGPMIRAMSKDKPGFVSGSFEPTGKSETVAGIRGHVYHATWTDAQGKHEGEAVLTSDPRVVEMTRGYLALVDSIGAGDDAASHFNLPASESGLLRLGDQFRVLSISGDTPPAEDFKLPAKPMSLMDMIKSGMGGNG